MDGRRRSASTSSTRASGAWASAPARLIAVVVLPSPPPGLETAMTDMFSARCFCSITWRRARYCSASRLDGATRLTRWSSTCSMAPTGRRRRGGARLGLTAAEPQAAEAATGHAGRDPAAWPLSGTAVGGGGDGARLSGFRRGRPGAAGRPGAGAGPDRAGPARAPSGTCSQAHQRAQTRAPDPEAVWRRDRAPPPRIRDASRPPRTRRPPSRWRRRPRPSRASSCGGGPGGGRRAARRAGVSWTWRSWSWRSCSRTWRRERIGAPPCR